MMMDAIEPSSPEEQRFDGASSVSQRVLREVVEGHLDSCGDQLLRANRTDDPESLLRRSREVRAQLELVEAMLLSQVGDGE